MSDVSPAEQSQRENRQSAREAAQRPKSVELEAALARLKEPLRERIAAVRQAGREAALAVVARLEADAATAEAALAALRVPRKRRRRRAEMKRLERLLDALNDLASTAASGQMRYLKAIGRSLRRVSRALTEPID
jgi:hypothetical protein